MTEAGKLEKLSEEQHGILTAAQAVQAGISRTAIYRFIKQKEYERVARGVYLAPDAWPDEEYILQLRYPSMIFSHDTALYLHKLSDRIPFQLTVTAKAGCNPSRLADEGIKVYTMQKDLLQLGTTEMNSSCGHPLRLYDPERTICDILRSRSSMEPQVFFDALKYYAKSPSRNIPRLMEYASQLHVTKAAMHYMEVLL